MIKAWMMKPGAGAPPVTNYTKSLLHFNGDNNSTTFTDENGKTWTPNGSAKLLTAQKVFGTASGYFDGTGDYIDTPDHADFDVGAGDFTIDCWLRPDDLNEIGYVCGQGPSNGAVTSTSWEIGLNADDSVQGDVCTGATIKTAKTATSKYAAATWCHVALVRNGNTLTIYVNGVPGATTANLTGITVNTSANKPTIGRCGEYTGGSYYYKGYIEEFRFSKGIARWTGDFSASLPSAEYPYPDA
jgi:hypothetical protein